MALADLLGLFKSDHLSSRFNSAAFDRNIQRMLADNAIPAARQVGGIYALDDHARAELTAIMPSTPAFATATVVVSDRTSETASAYMAGTLVDGTQAIISLQNLGRLKDLQSVTDAFSARRSAHRMRQRLIALGEQKAPERNHGYTPRA